MTQELDKRQLIYLTETKYRVQIFSACTHSPPAFPHKINDGPSLVGRHWPKVERSLTLYKLSLIERPPLYSPSPFRLPDPFVGFGRSFRKILQLSRARGRSLRKFIASRTIFFFSLPPSFRCSAKIFSFTKSRATLLLFLLISTSTARKSARNLRILPNWLVQIYGARLSR